LSLATQNLPCDIKVENVGFSEALRAAWLFRGREWAIVRESDGSYLEYSAQAYHKSEKVAGKTRHVRSSSPLCPHIPAYWLDQNNWSLCVGL